MSGGARSIGEISVKVCLTLFAPIVRRQNEQYLYLEAGDIMKDFFWRPYSPICP